MRDGEGGQGAGLSVGIDWGKRVVSTASSACRKERRPGAPLGVIREDRLGVPHLPGYLVGSCVCGRIHQPGWSGVIRPTKQDSSDKRPSSPPLCQQQFCLSVCPDQAH